MENPDFRTPAQSTSHFLTHARFCYNDNKIIFFKYLAYTAGRILTYPFRKLAQALDNSDARYRRFIAGKKEVELKVLGNRMLLPTADEGLTRDLIIEGIREKNSVRAFFKEYKPNMNTIDLGANLGYYLLMEAKIAQKGAGKIYAVEPNPLTFNYLKKNVKLNGYKNIKLMNLGISDKKGTLPFYMAKSWNCSRFEKGEDDSDILSIKKVQVDTLDNLFRGKKIDFIRMDVEGYEFNILKGATQLIKKNPGLAIFFEFHAQFFNTKQREEFIRFLRQNHLRVKYFFTGSKNIFARRSYIDIRNALYTTYYLYLEAQPPGFKRSAF
ncbi:FkbM family methyltransferase [Candidatus Pacearchaeota archaeon]|nr:FkbM family methyltransferase [Candidatus Pacearchaeota archaeon]